MLRSILTAGRWSLPAEYSSCVRMMAAGAPKVTLEQYVEGMRNTIAEAYADRVTKYDGYIAAIGKYISTTGLPRANDFSAVKAFAQKRAEMLQQVGFPDDWKVRGAQADKIREILKSIPEGRKTAEEGKAPWYLSLTDAQVAECDKDPQLFVVCDLTSRAESQYISTIVKQVRPQELSKVHAFEDQFNLASQAQATKFGLPAITLDELPATMDPIEENTISANEVKWILETAKKQAESMRKNVPEIADPFSTAAFADAQKNIAERLGMSSEQLQAAQATMSPDKWRAAAADNGIAV